MAAGVDPPPDSVASSVKGAALKEYLLRFASVGVLNTLVGYAIIFVCMYVFLLSPLWSNVVGFGVGLILSFLLNRSYTFRSKEAVLPEASRFLFFFALAYSVNLAVLAWLTQCLDANKALSQVVAGATYSLAFFLLSKQFVFVGKGRR